MAIPLFQSTATLLCPHGGQGMTIASSTRVVFGGVPAAVLSDLTTIAGCAFVVASKPQPCVRVTWTSGAGRVQAGGRPVLFQSSTGLCLSAESIAQGAPVIVATQTRVSGT